MLLGSIMVCLSHKISDTLALTVTTAPLADTARYDHLRPEVTHD